MIQEILCRICWNTKNWMQPSGDAALLETGGSYAAAHGFGHEEWLFNFAWRDNDGSKYAFLQPIGKNWPKYMGTDCKVTLYTKAPDRWYFVAVIDPCHILTTEEQRYAYDLHKRRGWLEEMTHNLSRLNCDKKAFVADGERIFNIKFNKRDTVFFDPLKPVPINHEVMKFHRYQTLHGKIDTNISTEATARWHRKGSKQLKSTRPIVRKGGAGGETDPLHSKIQNGAYLCLKDKYGSEAVIMEEDGVDIKVRTADGLIFFEVKGYHTPKQCIREALWQLIEYAYWPPEEPVTSLTVVGESEPDEPTCQFLNTIRKKLGVPLYYVPFDLDSGQLGKLV